MTRAVQELIKHPYVDPACKCPIHRYLPKLQEMLELRSNDQLDGRTKLGMAYGIPDGGLAGGGATRIGERPLPPHFDTASFPEQEKRMITGSKSPRGCAGCSTIPARTRAAGAGITMRYPRLMS